VVVVVEEEGEVGAEGEDEDVSLHIQCNFHTICWYLYSSI
jgi:hypothetical protein